MSCSNDTKLAFNVSSSIGMPNNTPDSRKGNAVAKKRFSARFHLNVALTAVSLAKAAHYLCGENQTANRPTEASFSMADLKTQYSNQLLLNRFIEAFGMDAQQTNNSAKIKELCQIGRIAA